MMPPPPHFFTPLIASFLSLVVVSSGCSTQGRIITLVAPLFKDSATLQHTIQIQRKTPLQKERLVLDLSGDFLWVHCKTGYKSSTYLPVQCHTPLCTASGSANFGCGDCSTVPPGTKNCLNNTCTQLISNGVTEKEEFHAELSLDTLAISPSDGKSELSTKLIVPQFAFVCASSSLLRGLAKGAIGMAGMNWHPLAVPFQVTIALEFDRKFGLCLSSGDSPGGVFFGGPPYLPGPDKEFPYIKLNYTFLQIPKNPRAYFLKVSSIRINGKSLDIDPAEFKSGNGGTKLSTVVPYTQAATPIYSAIRDGFVKEAEAGGMRSVESVKPFDACFDAESVVSSKVGPAVPMIDLMLDNEYVFWRIYGANSMVEAKAGVLCLAFVDAWEYSAYSMVMGTHQLQDNLLQFDLIEFKLYFSSSLLASNNACSNFNFTSSRRDQLA